VRLEVVSDLLQAHQSLKMRKETRADVIYLHKEVTSCWYHKSYDDICLLSRDRRDGEIINIQSISCRQIRLIQRLLEM
jgi:hypothetical protein